MRCNSLELKGLQRYRRAIWWHREPARNGSIGEMFSAPYPPRTSWKRAQTIRLPSRRMMHMFHYPLVSIMQASTTCKIQLEPSLATLAEASLRAYLGRGIALPNISWLMQRPQAGVCYSNTPAVSVKSVVALCMPQIRSEVLPVPLCQAAMFGAGCWASSCTDDNDIGGTACSVSGPHPAVPPFTAVVLIR